MNAFLGESGEFTTREGLRVPVTVLDVRDTGSLLEARITETVWVPLKAIRLTDAVPAVPTEAGV